MSLLKPFRIALTAGLLLLASGAWAMSLDTSSAVQVRYDHPEKFTEARQTPPSRMTDADDYLGPLKRYIEHRAKHVLGPGQHLSIVITDVDLAGEYEPWSGAQTGWIRVVRRTYPPRIDLHFTLQDANGAVLKQGTRKLFDLDFMDTVSSTNSDPLRYEKALIDRWLKHGESGL